jgi:hypothetical protein
MDKILFEIRTVKWYVFLTEVNSMKGDVLKKYVLQHNRYGI